MQCIGFGVFFPLLVIKRSENSANARQSCTQLGISLFELHAVCCIALSTVSGDFTWKCDLKTSFE